MSLAPGVRLGPYEVLSAIGAGGMGEVYRARDTKLGRDVALKILPDAFASDFDRLARFAREAQVLASLNHPNIGGIYGLEETDGIGALVLELVEGQTLADRIAQGPISLDEALPIARQISGALEAAHEQGIIHRDLKPANIKVRDDGTVKVLDFGLAKALEPASAGRADVTASPTITSPAMTHMGIILGTAAYMSPEQAAGKSVDKRSDLWAFGVVLMEMLTGRPVFTGETVSHVLAAVLKSDPDWTALPAETPASIRRLLRRCLEKDRHRRLDSAGAARLEIDEVLVPPSETLAAPRPSRRVAPLTFGLAMLTGALIAALVTWAVMQPAPQDPALSSRFAITPSPANPLGISPFERVVALSPDGRHLAYQSPTLGTGGRLMLRPIDQLDARHLAGITNARGLFFSAESRWIGFFQGTDLKKVSITGGPTITLCGFDGGPRGASWGHDDIIVFATADPNTGLWRVPAGGGKPTVLTTPNAAQLEGDHIFPSVLPSGRGVLFTIAAPDQAENSDVAVLDLQTMQYKTLMRGGSQPEYVEPPTGSGQAGYLVYAAAGALRAVRFDLATLNVLSDPVPVLEHVRMAPTGAANYAVSRAGTLVYVPGGAAVQPTRSLVWVDRTGREEPIKAAPLRAYAIPRISPDGTRVAIDIRDQENDIWIWDLARETLRKLTYGPGMDQQPVWTPDGRRLIFASNRAGPSNLYGQAVDGTGPVDRLTTSGNSQFPTSMTPDGNTVVGHEDGPTSFDVVLFRLANLSASRPGSDAVSAGAGRSEVQPLVRTRFIEHNAEISPDGRYIAYQSNESGQIEIYVQPFPQVDGGKWQISTGGGTRAVWARNGRELFYVEGSNALVAVPVETSGPMFAWGKPVKLFDNKYAASLTFRSYDTAPDGQRFLMLKGDAAADENPTADGILVVLNWFEELKRLVPTN